MLVSVSISSKVRIRKRVMATEFWESLMASGETAIFPGD